jgi:hypothetical protein
MVPPQWELLLFKKVVVQARLISDSSPWDGIQGFALVVDSFNI